MPRRRPVLANSDAYTLSPPPSSVSHSTLLSLTLSISLNKGKQDYTALTPPTHTHDQQQPRRSLEAGPVPRRPERRAAAVSLAARVVTEATDHGLSFGDDGTGQPTVSVQRRRWLLPRGGVPPRGGSGVLGATADDEPPVLVRLVTIQARAALPAACEWWVRRAASAVPLALAFEGPPGEVVLPADGFPAGIRALPHRGRRRHGHLQR